MFKAEKSSKVKIITTLCHTFNQPLALAFNQSLEAELLRWHGCYYPIGSSKKVAESPTQIFLGARHTFLPHRQGPRMRDEPLRTSTWEANVFLSVAETVVSKVLSRGSVSCFQSYILHQWWLNLSASPWNYTTYPCHTHPGNCLSGLRWLKCVIITLP